MAQDEFFPESYLDGTYSSQEQVDFEADILRKEAMAFLFLQAVTCTHLPSNIEHDSTLFVLLPPVHQGAAGFIYDEGGKRGRICLAGEKATWTKDGKNVKATLIDAAEFKQLFHLLTKLGFVFSKEYSHIEKL